MLVTCKLCKTKIDKETAYKISTVSSTTGKVTNTYFCSEAEYQTEEDRKKKAAADKDKVYYLICDIMGVPEIIHTSLWKEKQIWNKAFSDEFIGKYLEENKEELTKAISRASDSEYARIRYLSAFLKNNLRDFKPKTEVVEKSKVVESSVSIDQTFEIYNGSTIMNNRRRSFDEME